MIDQDLLIVESFKQEIEKRSSYLGLGWINGHRLCYYCRNKRFIELACYEDYVLIWEEREEGEALYHYSQSNPITFNYSDPKAIEKVIEHMLQVLET